MVVCLKNGICEENRLFLFFDLRFPFQIVEINPFDFGNIHGSFFDDDVQVLRRCVIEKIK